MATSRKIITFGDDAFRLQKFRLAKEAERTGWFDSIEVHSPETISGFLGLHKDFVSKSKGYGCWIWKPHIMLETLKSMNDGDFLFYLDAGASILKSREDRFREYIDLMSGSETPVIGFFDGGSFGQPPQYKERILQKGRVLRRFGLDGDESFLESGQVEGGIIACMKSDFTVEFLKEWMSLVLEDGYSLVNDDDDEPPPPGFVEHRHDQSILSILCKIRGSILLGSVECYGRGPFFSSRITDAGARPFAPDGFRRESDYDHNRHFDWFEYLSDPEVIERTMNTVKEAVKRSQSSIDFSFYEDPKKRFLDLFLGELEGVQFRRGLYKVSVEFHEPSPDESQRWESLVGSVRCEFNKGNERAFNFALNKGSAEFQQELHSARRLYRSEFTRTWDCNY